MHEMQVLYLCGQDPLDTPMRAPLIPTATSLSKLVTVEGYQNNAHCRKTRLTLRAYGEICGVSQRSHHTLWFHRQLRMEKGKR